MDKVRANSTLWNCWDPVDGDGDLGVLKHFLVLSFFDREGLFDTVRLIKGNLLA